MISYSYPYDCTHPLDTPGPGEPTLTPGELCPTGIVVESFTAHSQQPDYSMAILITFLFVVAIVIAIAKRKKIV